MTRKYFKSEEQNKKENKQRAKRDYVAEREAREKWLVSDEAKAAIEKMRMTNELSQALQVKSMTFIGKPKESTVDKGLSDLSQALVDKMMKR